MSVSESRLSTAEDVIANCMEAKVHPAIAMQAQAIGAFAENPPGRELIAIAISDNITPLKVIPCDRTDDNQVTLPQEGEHAGAMKIK